MKVFVKFVGSAKIEIEIESSYTVQQLKEMIRKVLNLSEGNIKIIHMGCIIIDDKKTLFQCDIHEGTIVTAMFKKKVGRKKIPNATIEDNISDKGKESSVVQHNNASPKAETDNIDIRKAEVPLNDDNKFHEKSSKLYEGKIGKKIVDSKLSSKKKEYSDIASAKEEDIFGDKNNIEEHKSPAQIFSQPRTTSAEAKKNTNEEEEDKSKEAVPIRNKKNNDEIPPEEITFSKTKSELPYSDVSSFPQNSGPNDLGESNEKASLEKKIASKKNESDKILTENEIPPKLSSSSDINTIPPHKEETKETFPKSEIDIKTQSLASEFSKEQEEKIKRLCEIGWSRELAVSSLLKVNWNLSLASEVILMENEKMEAERHGGIRASSIFQPARDPSMHNFQYVPRKIPLHKIPLNPAYEYLYSDIKFPGSIPPSFLQRIRINHINKK